MSIGALRRRTDRLHLPERLHADLTLQPSGLHLVRIEGPIGDVTIEGAQIRALIAALEEAQERIDFDDGRITDRTNPARIPLGVGAG